MSNHHLDQCSLFQAAGFNPIEAGAARLNIVRRNSGWAGTAAGSLPVARATARNAQVQLNAPVRIRNLASIEIERHLLEVGGQQNREVHLRFPAAEVKNANDLEFPLMPESVALLEVYLSEWWHLLLAEPSPFLFPGEQPDRHKGKGALSSQIRDLVYAYTRLEMPAHRFRHAVGKIYLDRHPGQYEIVRQLLGHKDITTTTAFYAGAESASAARHYHRTILGIRSGSLDREAADD